MTRWPGLRGGHSLSRFKGGATPDAAFALDSPAALELEQQLKRVIGYDEGADLNISAVRFLSDYDLYRILTLAAIGNFTTAPASSWQQPVSVVVAPDTGLFVVQVWPLIRVRLVILGMTCACGRAPPTRTPSRCACSC